MALQFIERFERLTGHRPFPWQQALYERLLTGDVPPACDVPTGLGKTSVIAVWLLARSAGAPLPRRLAYVVNRRTVVDQTTVEVERLRSNLAKAGIDFDLAVSTLRGQHADNSAWTADVARPAIVCGTVDMIGSRLLFGGYRIGFRSRPFHAGLLGQDTLLVHDEAHLEPAFQRLLEAIVREQEGRDPWPLRVLALTATSRGTSGLGIGNDDRRDPEARRRLRAPKVLHLHPHGDKDLVPKVVDKALALGGAGAAVLLFLRTVDDVLAAVGQLRKEGARAQALTGTMRGFERDRLVTHDEVFRRFLPESATPAAREAAYLVCTSAGEVGVNLSADHLVCDLSTFDAMAQRFGRVNRFGGRKESEVHVFHPAETSLDPKHPVDARRRATLDLLRRLDGEASPLALSNLDARDRLAAFAPEPRVLDATDIIFDAWAMTTIPGRLPGRPPLEPYLHGVADWEPPTCHVAWRDDVDLVTGSLLDRYGAREFLDDYPLKPHELLSDRASRVLATLGKLLGRREHPESVVVWIVGDNGEVEPVSLSSLLDKDPKKAEEDLRACTVVLPPSFCVPHGGLLSAEPPSADDVSPGDVSDRWLDEDGRPRRFRTLEGGPVPPGMRLVRSVQLGGFDDDVDEEAAAPRRWDWFEAARGADGEGSRVTTAPIPLDTHLADVEREARRLVGELRLPDDLALAVVTAARLHDRGKNRRVWQRSIGNSEPGLVLAKSGGLNRPLDATRYRHELGSLLDARSDPQLAALPAELRDLALHLVAAHHGRARPHFPAEELFDPDTTQDPAATGVEVISRFARLQRRYGRWGLAYLESLLRAADHAASAAASGGRNGR